MSIQEWLQSNREYEQGRTLYERHGTSAVLKKLFAQGSTIFNRKRLLQELQNLAKTSPAIPVKAPAIPASKPAPQASPLQAIKDQMQPLYDERRLYHSQMQVAPNKKERGRLAFLILDISDKLTHLWEQHNYVELHGKLPEVAPTAIPEDANNQQKKLQNLLSQRSKLRKRPDRLADLEQVEKQIEQLREALKDG